MDISYSDLLIVTNLLDKSLKDLIDNDKHLFKTTSGELTLNHRLAVYLEKNLTPDYSDYNVDCEYYRDTTNKIKGRKHIAGINVIPDIIIHKRGNNFPSNYLYLEAKRKPTNTDADFHKIESFIISNDYRYHFGVFVNYLSSAQKISYILFYKENDIVVSTERFIYK